MDRMRVYELIYALAAIEGRAQAFFGSSAPLAYEAFCRSLAGEGFPELWFEIPLAGDPWFDLHALTACEDLDAGSTFDAETCGGYPAVFEWFAAQKHAARQLALSWDTGSGSVEQPAIQLLRRHKDTQLTCDFLEAVGRHDAVPAYRAFESRLPEDWFACYTGVFPTRREPFLRVECIPEHGLQKAYADDRALLAAHLRQTGLPDINDTLLQRCQTLAATPFQFEFQFDVTPDGSAGRTFSASARFAMPSTASAENTFCVDGEAGALMRQVQDWGLADGRWLLLGDAMYARRISVGGESCLTYCYPAFLKLRWRNGDPLDAKAYLIAGSQK